MAIPPVSTSNSADEARRIAALQEQQQRQQQQAAAKAKAASSQPPTGHPTQRLAREYDGESRALARQQTTAAQTKPAGSTAPAEKAKPVATQPPSGHPSQRRAPEYDGESRAVAREQNVRVQANPAPKQRSLPTPGSNGGSTAAPSSAGSVEVARGVRLDQTSGKVTTTNRDSAGWTSSPPIPDPQTGPVAAADGASNITVPKSVALQPFQLQFGRQSSPPPFIVTPGGSGQLLPGYGLGGTVSFAGDGMDGTVGLGSPSSLNTVPAGPNPVQTLVNVPGQKGEERLINVPGQRGEQRLINVPGQRGKESLINVPGQKGEERLINVPAPQNPTQTLPREPLWGGLVPRNAVPEALRPRHGAAQAPATTQVVELPPSVESDGKSDPLGIGPQGRPLSEPRNDDPNKVVTGREIAPRQAGDVNSGAGKSAGDVAAGVGGPTRSTGHNVQGPAYDGEARAIAREQSVQNSGPASAESGPGKPESVRIEGFDRNEPVVNDVVKWMREKWNTKEGRRKILNGGLNIGALKNGDSSKVVFNEPSGKHSEDLLDVNRSTKGVLFSERRPCNGVEGGVKGNELQSCRGKVEGSGLTNDLWIYPSDHTRSTQDPTRAIANKRMIVESRVIAMFGDNENTRKALGRHFDRNDDGLLNKLTVTPDPKVP